MKKELVYAAVNKLLNGEKTEAAIAKAARYMAEVLKVASVTTCRAMVREAVIYGGAGC